MARISPAMLRRYLLGGFLSPRGCQRLRHKQRSSQFLCHYKIHTAESRSFESVLPSDIIVPFRKQLKDEKKQRQKEMVTAAAPKDYKKLRDWELTVGIEIHAQLNTEKKLFSHARSTINEKANTQVALFDAAFPGSMPIFQKDTLIPAIRAALAMNCEIQTVSKFDRKHYFHWDQPAGYQLTQYYEPYAKDGYITLYAHDGIAEEDGNEIRVGIKQIQMEQDTAKTITQEDGVHLIDYNRAGLPLIEIITLPHIHHPNTAAALVRKIQRILETVDACILGMESGGLRADVNVSVRRCGTEAVHEYAGIEGLGQRTEIKNLSSFKSIQDAIIAERDRQISVLEKGGVIEAETRGWSIGGTGTRRLRGKEGEIDYRYMPDPDINPIVIGQDLVKYLAKTLGIPLDEEINILVEKCGLSPKDAMTLSSLNNGGRAEFFRLALDSLRSAFPQKCTKELGRLCCNWVLHEMGGLTHPDTDHVNPLRMHSDGWCLVPDVYFVDLLTHLIKKEITGKTAKYVLNRVFCNAVERKDQTPKMIIEKEKLWYRPMDEETQRKLAWSVFDLKIVEEILSGKEGKINFLVGKMIRASKNGNVDPEAAKKVLMSMIEDHQKAKEAVKTFVGRVNEPANMTMKNIEGREGQPSSKKS